MIGIAIHGAAGRMGQRLIALGSQDEEVRLTAAIESSGHPQVGQDAGLVAGVGELGLFFSPEWGQGTEAVIDFSVPAAAEAITRTCLERKRRFKTLLNVPDGYSSWDGVRNAVWSLAVGKGHHMWVLGFHIYFAPQLIENGTMLGVKLVVVLNECGQIMSLKTSADFLQKTV